MSEPGFRNIEPRAREERLGKDVFQRAKVNPVLPAQGSPQYVNECQRFQRDAAAAELQKKHEKLHKQENIYETKRAEAYHREKTCHEKMENAMQRHEQVIQHKRETGEGAKRNQSGQHYQIITLEYNQTPEGQKLKAKDESVLLKSQLRSINLYNKANSVSHNIITGEPRNPVALPHRPLN
ncbi:hypothetical protein CEUSTIGMA_g6313.t1 [Chlamydomonas eustigma]|uniref:Uncharacterized protein n=1 Tax=Chlamydomonas eustigma TaxID=1157962 RepID=A0A250X713_9CHLO|nr:hypothetical protein CEUSTIGMA_g6313.t1 [Chlamydomonas eustigma]|eukprot:GAX78874.1 hypothetical protein CEUSTIGMA_g6313.t1 [Chlamydomonas eustigma]